MTDIQQKAQDLFNQFYEVGQNNLVHTANNKQAKICALILVNEILEDKPDYNATPINIRLTHAQIEFWEGIKIELKTNY